MLTHKQKELLMLIHNHEKDGGVSPSFEEMKDELGLKSKSGIHRLITGLEERGYIRRLPNKARALEILRLPTDSAVTDPANLVRFPNKPSGGAAANSDLLEIPLYGRIAAGNPISAIADETRTLEIPASMIGKGEHYALEIYGDSMIEAGIHDGDVAVISRSERVSNGDIAVCLVEDSEATLKYFRQDKDVITLTPANRQHQTQVYASRSVKVQGRLCSLLRKY